MAKKLTSKDETLEFLEEINKSFLERVKKYGFNTVEEYIKAGELFYSYEFQGSSRYPVGSDC